MVPTTHKQTAVEHYVTGVYHTNGIYHHGKLVSYQLEGNRYQGKRYMHYDRDPFSEYQNFLYKRAIHGLKAFPQDEVKYMHWEKKKRIMKVQKRAREVITSLKQEVIIRYTNSLLFLLHPMRELIEKNPQFSQVDPLIDDNITLKDLDLTKVDVAARLIEVGILPDNFYELRKDPNAGQRLPRLNERTNSLSVSG